MGRTAEATQPSIDRASFEDLLARAARGEFTGGRPVHCDDLEPPLEDAVRERIAAIVDVAEASGHEQVLVIAGDRPLVVDVADRSVEAELAGSESPEELHPIDAAVRLSIDPEPDVAATPADLPTGILPEAIAEAIRSGGRTSPSIRQIHSQEATDDAA